MPLLVPPLPPPPAKVSSQLVLYSCLLPKETRRALYWSNEPSDFSFNKEDPFIANGFDPMRAGNNVPSIDLLQSIKFFLYCLLPTIMFHSLGICIRYRKLAMEDKATWKDEREKPTCSDQVMNEPDQKLDQDLDHELVQVKGEGTYLQYLKNFFARTPSQV